MTLEDMKIRIMDVPGVRSVWIDANTDVKTVGNMPPLSMVITVVGGDAQQIADAIYSCKPVGMELLGDLEVEVGEFGDRVRFDRP